MTDYQTCYRKNYYELPRDYILPKTEREKDDEGSVSKSKEKTLKAEKKNLYGMTLNEM